ncbi:MAG: MFS transporter [Polyangiaceae bacterium]
MNGERERLRRIYALTFVESLGSVLLQRGLYFYTHDVLGFGDTQNLWLALASGVAYVLGALSSHRVAERFGERRVLLCTIVGLLGLHLVLMQSSSLWPLMVAYPLVGALQGIKWPLVESFLSAGLSPSELVRKLGRFNVTWAASVPVALVATGQLINSSFSGAFFAAAVGLDALALVLALPLPVRPMHATDSHPERPAEHEVTRLSRLLSSARWCMLLSYTLLFLLAPLMPAVFASLGIAVGKATAAAAVLDLARLACFACAGAFTAWRGRTSPHIVALACLPLGFVLVLFAPSLLWVLVGEIVFGLAAGFTYSAALYYALLLKNASVDAGGAHESLIGLGFALGPLAGLAGSVAASSIGNGTLALLVSSAPLALGCAFLALRPLSQRAVRILKRRLSFLNGHPASRRGENPKTRTIPTPRNARATNRAFLPPKPERRTWHGACSLFRSMSPASPSSFAPVRAPSLVTRLVELRESADFLARDRARDAASMLTETRQLLEAAFSALPRIHDGGRTLEPGMAQAETFALRELAAARRHAELAARSNETCRAACELSLRALTRGIDSLLTELVPHSMVPTI